MIRKAIIPAAGLGTRFLPATKAQPKEMLPIVDKPAIQYIVEEAIESGVEDIIIVTGKHKRAIEDHFDKSIELELMLEEKGNQKMLEMVQQISNLADIHYIRQKQPLGLGHAVLCARKFIGNEPFAVLLGDDIIMSKTPTLKSMIDMYNQHRTSVIGSMMVSPAEVDRYGIISPEEEDGIIKIRDLVEKPQPDQAPSNLAVIGRYIIEPEIFSILEQAKPGKGGEIQLTDALRVLNQQKQMIAYPLEGVRYDIGDKFGYIKATVDIALERPELAEQVREYLTSLVQSWGQRR
ncbi:UTP--glucose-1-phosphate uridylyltransferase [Insulibacter thermoxylanivorax]|uniref:UTP--glucose-1-phosphate uridylyltransferase n=1 Tax=Insulibacter thermoxylanivorax TaxID=2749268 RepID=A0A916QBQ6_9BACL|nr:UTP--glucose-1-phosphate uridylyltransferase GalU [Insulibacter thermoxylanivorax]GFR37810.1 UTP--glucose-1-phosphate uridylyltransferase [Insulibacter thermoxylanivorax]